MALNAAAVALLFLFDGGGLGNTIAAGYADGQLSRSLLAVGSGLAILVAFGLDRLVAMAERRVGRRR